MHAKRSMNLKTRITSVLSLGAIVCGSFFASSSCQGQQINQAARIGTVAAITVIPNRSETVVESKIEKVKPKAKKIEKPKFYSYADAYKKAKKENKPFVAIVTATWCPPCQAMKNDSIPQLKKNGGLEGVIVALVDVDKEKVLASQLTQGSGIPYVVVFEKKGKSWNRRSAAGYQSPLALKSFIKPNKAISTAAIGTVVR